MVTHRYIFACSVYIQAIIGSKCAMRCGGLSGCIIVNCGTAFLGRKNDPGCKKKVASIESA